MYNFKFIDLFAGIGGFHLAFHRLGGECVFASEKDPFARKTYEENFKKISPGLFSTEYFNDDIRKIEPHILPDFDVLCAGFPCQPFSQAGYKRGFNDNYNSERGNLFFNIVDIIKEKKPKAYFLENVRGLINHDEGNTFKVIRNILENVLGYSFHFKVVKAVDYGLPQLRPRVFIIGFRDEPILSNFEFPPSLPLKFNISDVWEGKCEREIGLTLRVGGRGSDIKDKRNWDSYIVDGVVRKISSKEAKKMQGFPEDFSFPVSETQAMKQLGNSVAIDAIQECGRALLEYMNSKGEAMSNTKNKGEWTEIYSFLKIILEKKIFLSDKNLERKKDSFFKINAVSTLNIPSKVFLTSRGGIEVRNGNKTKKYKVKDIVTFDLLDKIKNKIKSSSLTFEVKEFAQIQGKLDINIINGGNSNQKSDITLDIENYDFKKIDEGFGIKSYLGSNPTLLNASSNTNFVYEVIGIKRTLLEEVNNIETRTKLKDRINLITKNGGRFIFSHIESETLSYNLSLVDSIIPELLSQMVLNFYCNRINNFKDNINSLSNSISGLSANEISIKVKRLLVAILLGFFAGKYWDGKYISNGNIVVKSDGEQVAFHITDLSSFEEYLLETAKFDTPSTTRHRYGSLFIETNKKMYFKLNLQIRL